MIGVGYVGLVSGACFAELGHTVSCIDTDSVKINKLCSGELPIYEPGLAEMVQHNVRAGRLSFTTDLAQAVYDTEAVFIAVGTPSCADGQADLRYVFNVARDLAGSLSRFAVVVTKSTVPVGTNRRISEIIRECNTKLDFEVASNPEFLKEGVAIDDFMRPDRIVYGADSERSIRVLERIYQPLRDQGYTLLGTNLETAELIKYASNAFLATKITFINEMAALCETVGADVCQLAEGMGSDTRIGRKFLNAGPGYGGSCFPKDTKAIAQTGRQFGYRQSIIEAVISANDAIKHRMIDKIVALCGGAVAGKTIAVLGSTFKAGTDDTRDAPSLTIVPSLIELGAKLRISDPQGSVAGLALFKDVVWTADPYDCVKDADAVVILTEWSEFRMINLSQLAQKMACPRMADLRNLFEGQAAIEAGFTAYAGVGSAPIFDSKMISLGQKFPLEDRKTRANPIIL